MIGGLLITFEGGEGAGKTTQARMLAATLDAAGHSVLTTRQPANPLLRTMLLDPDTVMDPRTEALLYAADRSEHVAAVIRPALAAGQIVICDRYLDSSVAYQGYGRRLGADAIYRLSEWATCGLMPDLTIVLDISPKTGLARTRTTGPLDRISGEGVSFHNSVRSAFASETVHRGADRQFLLVAAARPQAAIAGEIHARVKRLIDERSRR